MIIIRLIFFLSLIHWWLIIEGLMKVSFRPLHSPKNAWVVLLELHPPRWAISLHKDGSQLCESWVPPRAVSWWTFTDGAVVQMWDFMSCSNIAPGWTDDDPTSSISGHPEPTLHRFLIQDFEDFHYLILFCSLKILIFLLVRSVLLNIFNKYHEKNISLNLAS